MIMVEKYLLGNIMMEDQADGFIFMIKTRKKMAFKNM